MSESYIEDYVDDSRELVNKLTASVRALDAGQLSLEQASVLRLQILETIELFDSHLRELDEMEQADKELSDGEE